MRVRNPFRVLICSAMAGAFLAACAPKPAPIVTPAVAEGKTSYAYIFDPSDTETHLPTNVQFVRPHPAGATPLPKYPERPLLAHDGPHAEIVRIVIDEQGAVSKVLDSPLGRSDLSPFSDDYREAVRLAVSAWRYAPGQLQHVADGPDRDHDGKPDYKQMTSSEVIAVYYDIKFIFNIVDGRGVVSEK